MFRKTSPAGAPASGCGDHQRWRVQTRSSLRLAGLVGANLRLGWSYVYSERAPAPQIGAFIGFFRR